jgi:hypothetical protein
MMHSSRSNNNNNTSTGDISAAISAIDKAIADLSTQESINISATARKYGIIPCTLNRCWHGVTTTAEQADDSKQMMASDSSTSRRLHSSSTISMSSLGKPLPLHQLWSPPMQHNLVEGLLDTTGPQDLSAITAQDWPLNMSTPLTLIGNKLTQYGLTSSTTS